MHLPSFSQAWGAVTSTVAIASFVCNFLPKSTVFDKYPRVKNAYETGINFIIFFGANLRSNLPSLNWHIPGLGFDKPQDQTNAKTGA